MKISTCTRADKILILYIPVVLQKRRGRVDHNHANTIETFNRTDLNSAFYAHCGAAREKLVPSGNIFLDIILIPIHGRTRL